MLKEYEYVVDKIKDSENVIEKIKEDSELSRKIEIIARINGSGIISAVRMMCIFLIGSIDFRGVKSQIIIWD